MASFRFLPALIAGLLLLLVDNARADASKAETTPAASSEKSGPNFRSAVEKRTFELINAYRQSHDFAPLAWNDDIAKIARAHSKDMASGDVDFGHGGFSDRAQKLKAAMPGFRGIAENVLYTSNLDEVAPSAVTMWLHSPHHLANIRGDYNSSGLGVWQNQDGTIYFTQIFVKTVAP